MLIIPLSVLTQFYDYYKTNNNNLLFVPKAPAIVEPGKNTTTEVPEDGFRFFQTECTAFSPFVIIEQIDIYGRCSLYASNVISNPGPLDDYDLVVRNEDKTKDRRSVSLKLKVLRKVILSKYWPCVSNRPVILIRLMLAYMLS